MTVAALSPSASYLENGVTLAFAAPFRFLDPTHLEVKRIAADGAVSVLGYGTDYTVTGGSTDAGGTVTLGASVNGATLKIRRVTPRAQQTDYVTGDTFPAETHEAALDRQMLIDQEQDVKIQDTALRALMWPEGEVAQTLPAKEAFIGKFVGGDASGNLVPLSGTGADAGLRTDLAGSQGFELIGGLPHPENFGCVAVEDGGGAIDNTADMVTAMQAGLGLNGRGKTYRVSALVATITNLHVDNMTLREINPNVGDPVTVTFQAAVPGSGYLFMGPGFKVDRAGDGTAGTLNVSCGIKVQSVGRVEAYCEIYGNGKGSGLLVDSARYFRDESYVHDMFCDHTAVIDDIQHGSWARYCDTVITGGIVRHLGNKVRSAAARDRYNRGRAYSGCKNIVIGGVVGPCVDQAYDVTGDAAGGNSCVKLAGAHADYPYSVGFKFANAVMGTVTAGGTVREPGLTGVIFSGPSTELVNMTSGAIISGIVQIGGGANGAWPEVSVVKLDRNDSAGEGREYPKNVMVTGNMLMHNASATTFTVLDSDELTPAAANPLNVHNGARVRLTTTGVLPAGLATATDYFVTITATGTIKLSSSFNNCIDGVFISGFAGGTGTHTITVQNDVDWGVFCNVDVYDSAAPNLVYGNRFGPVPERSTFVADLKATVTRSTNQSIPNATNAYLTGDAETDPYAICDLTGGTGSSTLFVVPLDGRWRIVAAGIWAGGSGSNSRQMVLQFDSGGGFADVAGHAAVGPYFAADFADTIQWEGFLAKGTAIRIRLYQNDGAARNFTVRECLVEFLPA